MITCPRVLCKYRSSTGQVEIMMEGGMTMAGRKPKPTAIKKLEGNEYTIRVSENSFVGAEVLQQKGDKGPDTTMRLFNLI